MDNYTLFSLLLNAETEDDVDAILRKAEYGSDDPNFWLPVGKLENNFAAIGNQQSDPAGALIEKIINGIDALLMAECYKQQFDPEGDNAPKTMAEAVERFFGVQQGRLNSLSAKEQNDLADNLHLVAVGSKSNPNYLIIDKGEGQTPAQFPDTFLSLMRSNKIRIPFVQGKFNSGGTGILQFCGNKNYQLIASRRHPDAPVKPEDETSGFWGFTIVRRMLPSDGRRNSVYVYLAPNGNVPTFIADGIPVLPGKSKANQPATPYEFNLDYGTCIKLYNYRWKGKSILTADGRPELERLLPSPCLPFRITETREYRANYYSATVTGGWASATATDNDGESKKLEDGFPAYAELNVGSIGKLPYQIAVFRESSNRREYLPRGVFFIVNGQVHGALPSDFVTRRLKFDYLTDASGPLLVLVDCTAMNPRVREDFFMASRDRVRRNETYIEIETLLAEDLRNHSGLQELNQLRRKKRMESHLNEEAPLDAFQKLLDADPTLSSLFSLGDRLVTTTGPSTEQPKFVGRQFPSYFRIQNEPKEGLVKLTPINGRGRIVFETDAQNDYFGRTKDPGEVNFYITTISSKYLVRNELYFAEHQSLCNGRFETRFAVPWNAEVGDKFKVTVKVSDVTRIEPFECSFILEAMAEIEHEPNTGPAIKPRTPKLDQTNRRHALALPNIVEVRKSEWSQYGPPFDTYESLRIKNDGKGGYDCLVNVDSGFLLTELSKSKDDDKPLVKYWFTYGLVLAAVGMIKHNLRIAELVQDGPELTEDNEADNLDSVGHYCSGLAQVIVPIIRSLNRGPVA